MTHPIETPKPTPTDIAELYKKPLAGRLFSPGQNVIFFHEGEWHHGDVIGVNKKGQVSIAPHQGRQGATRHRDSNEIWSRKDYNALLELLRKAEKAPA